MKILFITHHYLSSNGGGAFASRAYINAFAEAADEMTLLYPVKDGELLFPEINKKITAIPVAYKKAKVQKLIDLVLGKVHRYYETAPDYIKNGNYDFVVFDTSLVSMDLIKVAKQKGCKTIVIHHNYQYEYFRDNLQALQKALMLHWCKKYEGEAVRYADVNLTLTKDDTTLLRDHYDRDKKCKFDLIGTFEYKISSQKTINATINTKTKKEFVITGNLSAIQTEQSILPWLSDYYPILKEIFPESDLTIAGYNPSTKLANRCKELGVNIIPSPESMDSIMENADYYICPTCLGGGLKLRVMDGLKWGLPVISHAVSARGYDIFVEKGCMFSYTNPEEFRSSLCALKQKDFDKQKVYEDYCNGFSFKAGVERVKTILHTIGIN